MAITVVLSFAHDFLVIVDPPIVTTGTITVVLSNPLSITLAMPSPTLGQAIILTDPLDLTMSVPAVTPVETNKRIILTRPLILNMQLEPLQLATLITAARDKATIEPVYITEVTLKGPTPPTLYFATRQVIVDNRRYENYLNKVTGIDEGVKRNTSVSSNSSIVVVFKNDSFRGDDFLIELGDTNPFEGAVCIVKEVYFDDDGVTVSAAETLYAGVLESPQRVTSLSFECRVSSKVFHRNRLFRQQLVDTGTFPNAYEDVGKIVQYIYGANVVVPTWKTDWGARSTVLSSINDVVTTIGITDSSRFPSSGSVFIDDEEISYTGNTNNQLTGCTRGVGATDNVAHSAGANVWEKKASYLSVIGNHVMNAVNKIYAAIEGRLWRVVGGAVGQVTGGRHFVNATEQLKVAAVEDDVDVNDTIDVANDFSITEKRIERISTELPRQQVNLQGSARLKVSFPSAPSGTLSDIVMSITWAIVVDSNPSAPISFELGGNGGEGDIAIVNTDGSITQFMSNTINISKTAWAASQRLWLSRAEAGVYFMVTHAVQRATVTSAFSGDPDGGVTSKFPTSLPVQINDFSGNTFPITFPSAPSGNLTNVYAKFNVMVGVEVAPASRTTVSIDIPVAGGSGTAIWFFVETDGTVTWVLPASIWLSYDEWETSGAGAFQLYSNSASGSWILTFEEAEEFAISDAESSVSSASKTGSAVKTGGVVATHFVDRFYVDVDGYADPTGDFGGAASLIETPAYIIKHLLVQVVGHSLADDVDSPSFAAAAVLMAAATASGYKFAFAIQNKITPSRFAEDLARQCRSALYYSGGKWTLDFIPDSAPTPVKTVTKEELALRKSEFLFDKTPVATIINDLVIKYARDYMMFRGDSPWNKTVSKADSTSQTFYGETYLEEMEFSAIADDDTADDVADFIILQQANTLWHVMFPIFWEHFDLGVGDTFVIENSFNDGMKFFIERFKRIDQSSAMVVGLEWPS